MAARTKQRPPGVFSGRRYGTLGGTQDPIAPTPGTPVVTGATTVTLPWTDNSSNELGFIVQVDNGLGGGFVNASGDTNPTAAGVQTFNATGLIPATLYLWRVASTHGGGTNYTNGPNFTTDNPGGGGGGLGTSRLTQQRPPGVFSGRRYGTLGAPTGGLPTIGATPGAWNWAGTVAGITVPPTQIGATPGAWNWAGTTAGIAVPPTQIGATPGQWNWAGTQAGIVTLTVIGATPGQWNWAGTKAGIVSVAVPGQVGGGANQSGGSGRAKKRLAAEARFLQRLLAEDDMLLKMVRDLYAEGAFEPVEEEA